MRDPDQEIDHHEVEARLAEAKQADDAAHIRAIREVARLTRRVAELEAMLRAAGVKVRCPNCDDTGDVHDAAGEWRGTCTCPMGLRVRLADGRRIAPGVRVLPAPKRYDLVYQPLGAVMREAEDGEYVRWDAVEHLFTAGVLGTVKAKP